jgi:transcriptional regulator with XRE-family HTH domain
LQRRKKPQRLWRSQLYIRHHRAAAGINLTALAAAIGKSKGLVSQIEHGYCAASPETLEDIAAYFGLAHVGMLFEPPVPKGYRRQTIIVPDNNAQK